jgi:hypothetical protein
MAICVGAWSRFPRILCERVRLVRAGRFDGRGFRAGVSWAVVASPGELPSPSVWQQVRDLSWTRPRSRTASSKATPVFHRRGESNLVIIPLGSQKLLPASPVVFIRRADIGFGCGGLPALASVKNPKNNAMLQSD